MRRSECTCRLGLPVVVYLLTSLLAAHTAEAQALKGPLTVEGLHQQINHSAKNRAFGGVTVTKHGDVGLMFRNPAALRSLDGIQVSIGGLWQDRDQEQQQFFAPVRYYPNLSLLLEGLTDSVPDPDPDLFGFTPADTVQRPLDDIKPDWSRSNSHNLPLHAVLAVPFSFEGATITAGLGAVQYADLRHYDQNNNVLEPAVLSQRPLPTLRPTDDDPLRARWYRSLRSREGTLYGYGLALAAHIDRLNVTVGASGMVLDGSADDVEQVVARGRLTFFSNAFRADSSYGTITRSGTSNFSGSEFTVSGTLHGQYVSVGIVVRPPTEYTRKYDIQVIADTATAPTSELISGEDRFRLPWRGSVGLLLTPRDDLSVGLEYELRPYGSADYTPPVGVETSPWESSSLFRIGVEYHPASWLALRGGIRGEADVFVPDGSPIDSDPVLYRVYTVGFGLDFAGLQWNVAFEGGEMKYQDLWGSAISSNSATQYVLTTDISYTLPFRP